MPRRTPSLRAVAVGAQKVPDREVTKLVVAVDGTDMQVVRPRPVRRLGEEVEARRLGVRSEQVAETLERLHVPRALLDGGDGK
jgi:hypothetical protein